MIDNQLRYEVIPPIKPDIVYIWKNSIRLQTTENIWEGKKKQIRLPP